MEIWKNIKINNEATKYSVSDRGRVRNDISNRILTGCKAGNGYVQMVLNNNHYYVHQLVLCTFLNLSLETYKKLPTLMINHVNGVITDNRIENLMFVSGSENAIHAVQNGFFKKKDSKSDSNGRAVHFSDEIVRLIRKMYANTNLNQQKLAKVFGTTQPTISRIITKSRRQAVC